MSLRRWIQRAAALGLAFLPVQAALAGDPGCAHEIPKSYSAPHCPDMPIGPYDTIPQMPFADPTIPGGTTPPIGTTPTPAPDPSMTATPDVDLSGLAFGATGEGGSELAAPNMFGNLLNGSRSVSFFVSRVTGAGFLNDSGFTNIVNNKISENNSPIPRNRVGYRFNHFQNGATVRGLSPQQPPFDPNFFGFIESSTTRSSNVEMHTFDAEKTIFNGLASIQVRVPFASQLTSDLNLSYGTAGGLVQGTNLAGDPLFFQDPANPAAGLQPFQGISVLRTPENTFGNQSTQFGNLSLILKGLFYRDCKMALSGGLGVTAPTGQDTRVNVTDYLGLVQFNVAEIQRNRDFHIKNETWSLSPFVSALYAPTPRWFAQGFLQFDLPLNESDIRYRETLPITTSFFDLDRRLGRINFPPGSNGVLPPFEQQASIREQSLMHVDIGTGYYLRRNPDAPVITAIVPMVELHYTTTLEDAEIVSLNRDFAFAFSRFPNGALDPNLNNLQTPPAPQVGNQRNRVDILDITFGTTFEIMNRATLGVAVGFPLRDEDDRTFDWEGQIQLNYFFGGGLRGAPPQSY